MSKERLEDKIVEFRQLLALGHVNMGVLNKAHEIHELVIEQAERAQELEERNKFLEKAHQTNLKIAQYAQEQNKRYREALEFYASKETHEPVLRSESVYENGICISPPDLEPPVIYFDKGEIARKALEESS